MKIEIIGIPPSKPKLTVVSQLKPGVIYTHVYNGLPTTVGVALRGIVSPAIKFVELMRLDSTAKVSNIWDFGDTASPFGEFIPFAGVLKLSN